MKRLIQLLFFGCAALFTLSLFSCGSSRKVMGLEEGWDLLGEAKVNFIRDKDVITIRQRNMYTAIRFAVEDKDVRISELKIVMNNGDVLQPAINEDIKAGQQSRTIELAADGRILDRIEFKYRSLGGIFSGRATVTVVGRRYDPYRRY
ncbi:hypothetical protein [Flavisolibacter nicotianae]|uniref:hypothetical protein n=1 Tax=Flavisolibacter nicotianae TaxID=2364882 RepID=UPI000EAE4A30|nr:hypothetical protein [Flavisolibacter nicotianae]